MESQAHELALLVMLIVLLEIEFLAISAILQIVLTIFI